MTPEELLRELREPEHWQGLRAPRAGRSRPAARPALARAVPAVAALVIAALAVTGIGVGFAALHRNGLPAVSPSASPSARTQAFTGVLPGASHTYDATHEPSACTLGQLQVRPDPEGGGAGGSYFQPIYVQNLGDECVVTDGTIRVGGRVASFDPTLTANGLLLLPGAVADLAPSAVETCGGAGSKVNIDPSKPKLAIEIELGGEVQTIPERFPEPQCGGPVVVHPELRPDEAGRFQTPSRLTTSVKDLTDDGDGFLHYTVDLSYAGSGPVALGDCPGAIEVIQAGGRTVTRALGLECARGAVLRPGARSEIQVSAPVSSPSARGYQVSWFMPSQTGLIPASTTCALDRLRLSPDGESGGEVGNWFAHFRVENDGPACRIATAAFTIGDRPAVGASPNLSLAGHTTSTVRVSASQECPDGSSNVPVAVTSGRADRTDFEQQIFLVVSEQKQALNVPFPVLACTPASVEVQTR